MEISETRPAEQQLESIMNPTAPKRPERVGKLSTDQRLTYELEQLQLLQQHQLRSPHCVDLAHGYGQGGK